MTVNNRHYRRLLTADIVGCPDKLGELEGYLRGSPDLALVDALIESDILNKLLIPRTDALNVIAAFADACCKLEQFDGFQGAFDHEHFAKSLYGLLHVQTGEGLVEDLTHKDAVYDILYPNNPYYVYHGMTEAFARNKLIEAFEIMDIAYNGDCPKDLDLLFDECKSRYDRARKGMCSLDPVWEFIRELAFIRRPLKVKEVARYGFETHPLLLSRVLLYILFYQRQLDNILKFWPNILEEIVDAVLDWPQQHGTEYMQALHIIEYYFNDPRHAEIFSDLSLTKHIAIMNILNESLPIDQFGLNVMFGALKYKYSRVYGLELILYPWHTVLEYRTDKLARDVLGGLSRVKTFEEGPKYVLTVVWHLLNSLLSFMGEQAADGLSHDEYILSYVNSGRDTLEWYEEKGALDHEIPGVFPDVFEPGALKSFMLASCEEFSKDYYEVYGS